MPIPASHPSEMIRSSTAKERIHAILQQWVIDGTLAPGERLNDSELAKHFSISRTPVREAIQMLSEQGLVTIIPSSGTFVSQIDRNDLKYMYQVMISLSDLALRLCIDKITEKNLEHLIKLNDEYYAEMQNGSVSAAANAGYRFHRYICELSGNPYLLKYVDQLSILIIRNENHFIKEHTGVVDSYKAHQRIIEALRQRDLVSAAYEMEQNWSISID